MIPLKQAIRSSIGQKFITTLTGLGLVGFALTHLLGNLTLLSPNPELFNTYAKKLEDLGPILEVAEIGLVILFVAHIVNGYRLKRNHLKARPVGYVKWQSKGADQSNFASRNMALSGTVLLVFLILHIAQFKYGPGITEGYVTQIHGTVTRDLYKLVFETFQSPFFVGVYVIAMIFLWLHIKHGFWSAFQSLGVVNPRNNCVIALIGWVLAAALGVGFLALPIWLYFNIGGFLK